MKVCAVLLIAALCATTISAQETEERKLKDRAVSKEKVLLGKLTQAVANAEAKGVDVATEVAKVLRVKKEQALARVQKIQAQLQAELKGLEEKAKKQAAGVAQMQETLTGLQAVKEKLTIKA